MNIEKFRPMDQPFTDEDRIEMANSMGVALSHVKFIHIEHAIIDDVVGHVLVGTADD